MIGERFSKGFPGRLNPGEMPPYAVG